jgi:hypothetical protein
MNDSEFEKLLESAPENLPREMRRAIKFRKKFVKQMAAQKSNLNYLGMLQNGNDVIHTQMRKD